MIPSANPILNIILVYSKYFISRDDSITDKRTYRYNDMSEKMITTASGLVMWIKSKITTVEIIFPRLFSFSLILFHTLFTARQHTKMFFISPPKSHVFDASWLLTWLGRLTKVPLPPELGKTLQNQLRTSDGNSKHKTVVINDPLGQAHSHASSEYCFSFVLFC